MSIQLPSSLEMTDDEFFEFCQLNDYLHIERTAQGEIVVMPPTGWETGNRNIKASTQLELWSEKDGTGFATDSSAGFILPNGAERSPDAAWVRRSRLATLTPKQRQKFLPLCPDFVLELRSPSDRLSSLQQKMEEYILNGAQLGWLIDPTDRSVYVYRPGVAVERLDQPQQISGDPVLPGFVLDLKKIWELGI